MRSVWHRTLACRSARPVLFALTMLFALPCMAKVVDVIEFHNPALDHYFVTADPGEIAALDGGALGGAWKRTGNNFTGWEIATAPAGAVPVCRFFGTDQYRADGSRIGPNSHFYTADAAECELTRTGFTSVAGNGNTYPAWTFEANAFAVEPRASTLCAGGTRTLHRAYNNGARGDPNHRYATNLALLESMPGWVVEGAVMCIPQSTAFHVSVSRGDDTNSGARVAPFRTIERGLAAAAAVGGATVKVAGGVYNESPLLRSNTELVGAHSPDTWEVDAANFTTQINGRPRALAIGEAVNVGVRHVSVSSRSGDGNTDSSVAVSVYAARGVIISDSRLTSGDGAAGVDGAAGAAGAKGANGGNGGGAGNGSAGTGGGGGATNTPRRGGNGGAGACGFIEAGVAGSAGVRGTRTGTSGTGGPGGAASFGSVQAGGRGNNAASNMGSSPPGQSAEPGGSIEVERVDEFITGLRIVANRASDGGTGQTGAGGGGGGGGG